MKPKKKNRKRYSRKEWELRKKLYTIETRTDFFWDGYKQPQLGVDGEVLDETDNRDRR